MDYTDEGNIDKFEIFDYNYSVEISPHYYNPGHSESFGYNAEGIRVYKEEYEEEPGYTVRHEYTVSGSRIIKETVYYDGAEIFTLVFSYDENGSPIGYRFRRPNYPENVYDCYYYDKNLQGDIVGVYGSSGNLLVSYVYDAWGSCYPEYTNEGNDEYWDNPGEYFNPFRYRGYYYDEETGLYYVSSRYYDPEVGRWISADNRLSGVGGNILGYNMFAYCMNNPVNMFDITGSWPKWIETAGSWVNKNIIQPIKNFFTSSKQSEPSQDVNRRPYTGEPGSTYTAPNGDSRTYGPDGTPEHDYDHNDHGRPDKHLHDSNGGHNHDWENGVRGPAYSSIWKPIGGVALVAICAIGIGVVFVDDATGIGIADDFLYGPLGAGIGEGMILIFG